MYEEDESGSGLWVSCLSGVWLLGVDAGPGVNLCLSLPVCSYDWHDLNSVISACRAVRLKGMEQGWVFGF